MNDTISLTDSAESTEASTSDNKKEEPSRIDWKDIVKPLGLIVGGFLLFFFLPVDNARFTNAAIESLALAKWYAQEHVLLCLVPAFFIAGAVSVFVSQGAVMKYLGAGANKALSYGVASVSGSVLAVCSCTVLPLFAGIWKRGAGLGPAIAFLYSGPAINVLAIILTARILGPEIGLARAVGAVFFSIVIGLFMHLLFRKEEKAKVAAAIYMPEPEVERPLWQTALLFVVMIGLLVSATWGRPEQAGSFWSSVFAVKWLLVGGFAILLGILMVRWMHVKLSKLIIAAAIVFTPALALPRLPLISFSIGIIAFIILLTTTRGETESWFLASWDFAKQIMPLLLAGVLVAGLLLGQPESEGLIPSKWISGLVGGNSFWANLFASVVGAFMYFATLTEVPILQGLIGAGMGKGPALALLLAGPALSLPNMLVIRSVLGTRKTSAFIALVVVMATISGLIFGHFF
jgi:uncharacterized membrane protein YraQ (UPF0718 family)